MSLIEKIKLNKQIKNLQKAVNNGDAKSMYDLAIIYRNNFTDKTHIQQANELMKQSANLGYLPAKTYIISGKIGDIATIGARAIDEIIKTVK